MNEDIIDTNPNPYNFFLILIINSSGVALNICPKADSIDNR